MNLWKSGIMINKFSWWISHNEHAEVGICWWRAENEFKMFMCFSGWSFHDLCVEGGQKLRMCMFYWVEFPCPVCWRRAENEFKVYVFQWVEFPCHVCWGRAKIELKMLYTFQWVEYPCPVCRGWHPENELKMLYMCFSRRSFHDLCVQGGQKLN